MAHRPESGRGFDRSYKRGAVMGLTVAEAFILLAFCLMLLFTWWQLDTERRSLIAADRLADLTPEQKAEIIAGLTDGTFDLALALRRAGVDLSASGAVEDLAQYSRFMREEDLRQLMQAAVKLSPDTRLSLSNMVEVTKESALRAMLARARAGDDALGVVASRLKVAAQAESDLVALLNGTLGETIRAAGGSIDAGGTITLPQSVLFDVGQDHVKDPGFLMSFCASWLGSIRDSGVDPSDLRIEGHASSEGTTGQTAGQAYLYNLGLSQRRAQNALELCLKGIRDPRARDWAQQYLAAIGYSSARLIYNPDGTENREASRRVMFSVGLDQKGLIEDIEREVSPTDIVMAATGPARVVDGDTIRIDGTRFRLAGIDAPEMGQPCVNREGRAFDCGEVARRGLEEVVAGRDVSCTAETIDRYDRPVARCMVDGTDLAEVMVKSGFAVPFAEYSDSYTALGEVAQTNKVGVWNTTFEMPWDYRAAR